MKLLDPFSVVLMAALMCAVMSAVLFGARRGFPAEVRGLTYWGAALAVQVFSAFCFALRGTLPDVLVLPVANVLFVFGNGLCVIGLRRFYGLAPRWPMLGGACGFALVGMLYYLVVEPDYAARVAWMSVPITLISGAQLVLVLRHGRRKLATLFFGSLIAVNTVLVTVRGVVALTHGAALVDVTRPGLFQGFYLAVTALQPALLAVGFLMVAYERLRLILERRSASDPLTGVLNRRGFGDAYAREVARMARMRQHARTLALLSVDLDHFKMINDRFGHAEGDRVLVSVAQMVGSALRESDVLARFGGEEFIVLLPDTDGKRAIGVAQRVQRLLREAHAGELPSCTASIGVAVQTDPEEPLDALLSRADEALYRAKENGRNRIETWQAAA
ncbi:GGDEF domain-containing protein [Pseudoduganella albidiflava]|uniref:diguanylate cyclase n=1 Tax=Pseudoduganella albidiflava TaxID=321983 RepID=A0A411X4C8_9BURK|nr:GGDEF domain-containing protein [Pseudoduganella albidiflava]QBI03728.1 GGDEF domain-containing protein [Pseudoduganella albidiflava]GGY62144.1 GGDEF domain-containing protein [Pseudoduganella albidiflava]